MLRRLFLLLFLAGCATHDVVIRNGTIYDGSGGAPFRGDVALRGERIAAVGTVTGRGRREIDAGGKAVAPGFINVMSQASVSLLADGRALSDVRQGVTLEIMGEGESMGPLSPQMKADMLAQQWVKFDVDWTTLGEYLASLERRGVSVNVASFLGAATPRVHVLGRENRTPTPAEMERMRALVRQAMNEGALGIASALIYAPAAYATTEELIELSKVAGEHGGMYISHLRSEGDRFVEAVDELIAIAREAKLPAEIYHLKAAGQRNWPKMDEVIARVEAARAQGLRITADMYLYTAASTGLDAVMPPWVQEGGYEAWRQRLKDPEIRARVIREMREPAGGWENFLVLAGSPDRIVLVGFRNEALRNLTGKTLAEVASMRGVSAEDAAIDLVIEDGSRVGAVYFLMSEENIRKQIRLPWVSFGSDGAALAAEGVFLQSKVHPRAYGNFARLLGRYVREEKVIPLEEAVRRMTSFAADTFNIRNRGRLRPGDFADVVVFDPATIADRATFEEPHQYATGVAHVFVNGVQVLRDGEHTGAKPGRAVRRGE